MQSENKAPGNESIDDRTRCIHQYPERTLCFVSGFISSALCGALLYAMFTAPQSGPGDELIPPPEWLTRITVFTPMLVAGVLGGMLSAFVGFYLRRIVKGGAYHNHLMWWVMSAFGSWAPVQPFIVLSAVHFIVQAGQMEIASIALAFVWSCFMVFFYAIGYLAMKYAGSLRSR